MTPRDILANAVDPGLALLVPCAIPVSDQARVLIMAIAGQESDWIGRRQNGCYTPGVFQAIGARSLWQFERLGGVAGVMGSTPLQLQSVCAYLLIPFNQDDIYEAMAWNDILGATMARLLLWSDPAPLPAFGDVQGGWEYYFRNWAPGAPRPDAWPAYYATAKGLL